MQYLPLILFTISTSITPGPNNTLILASGVNYGLKKSLPHLLGIAIGFPLMVVAIGLGLGGLFTTFPVLQTILKIVGSGYLLYLAYKVATAPTDSLEITKAKPFSFLQAALFQWVNPKAWMMAISAVVTFSDTEHPIISVFIIALNCLLFGIPCTGMWLLFGASLRELLSHPAYRRIFNITMAVLLVCSLIPIFRELYIGFNT